MDTNGNASSGGGQPVPPVQLPPTPPPPSNPTPVVPVQPAPPSPVAPKITLDDLYGPSPLDAQSYSPVATPQPVVTQPLQPPQAPVAPAQPPLEQVPSAPPPLQDTGLLEDLPLRKQRVDLTPVVHASSAPKPAQDTTEEVPASEQTKNSSEKPKEGVNKLSLFRILFAVVAAGVGLVVLLFVVTWISGFLHPVSSGKVSLTYWGLWEDSNTMQVAISGFEKQYPNITINYEKEDPKQYSQRLFTRIQQGNGPDIFTYHSSWLPMVQSILVPLPTSVISKSELQNGFYPVVRTDLVKNGALYGIPLGIDSLSLFVNNTLFQNAKAQVPTSWDSFSTTARAFTQKDGNGKIIVAGAAIGTYDNITHAPDIISALFVQNGVNISTMSPKVNAADALSFYTSFATGDSKVWDNTLDPSQLAFSKGNLAMYFGYSWDIFAFKAMNPSLDFSVYPIPHLPGRNTTVASYWVQGISSKSLHQKEAALFVHYLSQKDIQAALYAEEAKTRLFGEPYARSDLGITLRENKLVYPFVQQSMDATSSFFAGETQDSGINGQMNGYLGNAVRGILNNTSAASALDTLTQGVQQVENQYGSQ